MPRIVETDAADRRLEVLLFETSPFGNVDAIVQHDGRSIHFYLHPSPQAKETTPELDSLRQPMSAKACWVRNLLPGPYVINEDELREGIQPMLPRTYTTTSTPGRIPLPAELKIVWFEEGNGAALVESNAPPSNSSETEVKSRLLAVIPPWSGIGNFHGYAAECAVESPFCWPLPNNPKLLQRIDRAAEFWDSFQKSPDPFLVLKAEILDCYQHYVSSRKKEEPEYFSIDGGGFPPRGLVHWPLEQEHLLATVGMSLCSQPMVELESDCPEKFRRVELAIRLPHGVSSTVLHAARNGLASLASYPWRNFRWLGAGHTCQFTGVFPETEVAELVLDSSLNPHRPLSMPTFRNDSINMLWLIPKTP